MKKIFVMMTLMASFLFALNVKSATKDELMCIKGIGAKKADAILKFRKSGKLKTADDLLELKGFGKGIVKNIKNDTKTVACGGKKSSKKPSSNSSSSKKPDAKKTDSSK
jgi:competence protein ComEA